VDLYWQTTDDLSNQINLRRVVLGQSMSAFKMVLTLALLKNRTETFDVNKFLAMVHLPVVPKNVLHLIPFPVLNVAVLLIKNRF